MFKIINILVFVICFAFLLPAHAQERKRAVCDGVKNFDTEISVNFLNSSPNLITRYDLLEIEKNRESDFYKWRHPKEDYFWISDDGSLNSYYRFGVGIAVTTAIKAMPRQKKQGLFCVFLEHVKMDLYHDGVIFLDSAFDDIECAQYKAKLVDYMNKRHNQGQGTMMQKRADLLNSVSAKIDSIERGAIRKDKINLKASRIQKALKSGAKEFSRVIFDEIVSLNDEIKPNLDLIGQYQQCQTRLQYVTR